MGYTDRQLYDTFADSPFDVNKPKNDGKSHIGIENVRSRLRKMCGAELEITSETGNGTSAVIRLPKRNEDEQDIQNIKKG